MAVAVAVVSGTGIAHLHFLHVLLPEIPGFSGEEQRGSVPVCPECPGQMEREQEQEAGTAQQLLGRRVRADTRHPVYRGIRYRGGKWVSEIREPRKSNRIWLGTYPAPEMAAAAYDAAALALRGAEAALNFPGAAMSRPAPASCSPDDIRAAAAAAAAAVIGRSHSPQVGGEAAAGGGCGASTWSSGAGAQGPVPEHRAGDRRIVDEDDVFQVPRLLAGMAEGLMMSPPRLVGPATDGAVLLEEDGSEDGVVSLWDHS